MSTRLAGCLLLLPRVRERHAQELLEVFVVRSEERAQLVRHLLRYLHDGEVGVGGKKSNPQSAAQRKKKPKGLRCVCKPCTFRAVAHSASLRWRCRT